MRKSLIAVAAAVLWTPEAASGQTILAKADWRAKPVETYPSHISVPALDLDIRTKPPKLDAPFGSQAHALPHSSRPPCWIWGGT